MLLSKMDFESLTRKIKDYSGIIIDEDKEYLLEARLMPIARKYGLSSLPEFAAYMRENNDESLLIEVIEGMTTNESLFFRDIKPFEYLRDKILPEIFAANPEKSKFRIWSAASANGQEAYSIAMTLLECAAFADKKFEIIGTDIDMGVVEKAREGIYTQFEVQRGVPVMMLLKYFTQEGDQWRIKDNLRQMVKFDKFNLLASTLPLGKFDIIFCRNVLIYFDDSTKNKVLAGLSSASLPHTHLFTGSTESLLGLNNPFTQVEGLVNVFRIK